MNTEEKKKTYAEEALRLIRFRIQKDVPVLSAALPITKMEWTQKGSGTDAVALFWNVDEVLQLFQEGTKSLERKYLHLLLHGLYLHPFRNWKGKEESWHLACDILTEYRIDRMDVPGFERPIPAERNRFYRKIREDGIRLDERSVADWLDTLEPSILEHMRSIFLKDDHRYWKLSREEVSGSRLDHELCPERVKQELKAVHLWRTVFEQMELRETEHRRQAGGSAGDQEEYLVLEKERGYDYRRFLKRFAVNQEELMLDMDSFDDIPYDYSRRMYENLVLLEPLEYRDVKKLEEFVIAIDTSGSCSGEIVRQFLSETWEILSEKENFFRHMRIHLIQCDCMVQEHVCVTCEEEWKDYLEHLTIKGHGDTDFTPVFRLVDRMIQDRELKGLKGLLYFTDGDGIYPSEPPSYETAFVFLNRDLRKGKIPDWAIPLTLDRKMEM